MVIIESTSSSPGHAHILSRSHGENWSLHGCEIKSGSGLGTRLWINYKTYQPQDIIISHKPIWSTYGSQWNAHCVQLQCSKTAEINSNTYNEISHLYPLCAGLAQTCPNYSQAHELACAVYHIPSVFQLSETKYSNGTKFNFCTFAAQSTTLLKLGKVTQKFSVPMGLTDH